MTNRHTFALGTILALLAGGCSSTGPVDDGLSDNITGEIDSAILEQLENAGLQINRGYEPPSLEGSYRVNPMTLEASTYDDIRQPGYEFQPMTITLENQDHDALTVEMSYIHGNDDPGSGTASFISGEGDAFSLFAIAEGTLEGLPYKNLTVVSGEITTVGIANLQYAFVTIDDYDDPNNEILDPGQGRIIGDGDGMSPRQ